MKMDGPALRRKRDAKEASEAPTPDEGKDKQTKLIEKAVEQEKPLPDMETGRPKDSGRMGA